MLCFKVDGVKLISSNLWSYEIHYGKVASFAPKDSYLVIRTNRKNSIGKNVVYVSYM